MDIMSYMSDLRWLHASFHHQLHKSVCGTPLKGYHMILMLNLKSGGAMTAKELSEAMEVDKGHISRSLSGLLAEGYARRTGPERTAPFTLTEKGLKAVSRAENNLNRLGQIISSLLPPEDMEDFEGLLHRLAQALKAEAGPVPRMRKEE